ncbi:hypothetical protein H5410_064106 [Solanum commersonii]|uniref:Reverse transcriptase n=1 Tax=Solanum commersonii TaxID=4109 RepID=A0A9J5W154_SOLCO|nr:hypothetical protein H5410_064106 [Solanum commersonii]
MLGLEASKLIAMRLLMADRTVKKPIGVLKYVLVKEESVIFLADFVILDCEVDFGVPIILGRPFLSTGMPWSMKQESDLKLVSVVNHIVEQCSDVSIEERLGVDALAAVMMNFEGDGIEDYDELVAALDRNHDSPPAKPYVEEAPKLLLKALPSYLRYVFLGRDSTLPIIIADNLSEVQVEAMTTADIIGIPSGICSHKIQLMPDIKPSIEHQRILNPPTQEVVKKEIIKWLDVGFIYLIADSNWVCPVQCVPKKGVISMVSNAKSEPVSMRPVTRWRLIVLSPNSLVKRVVAFKSSKKEKKKPL